MKKIILAVFVMAFVVSCKEKVNYALVSGKIENTKASKIKIGKRGGDWKEIVLDKNGSFKDTIFNADGYYDFDIPRVVKAEMYLKNGFDIQITLDANQLYETITYKGVGNEINNYLANFHLKGSKLVKNLFALEEATFLDKIDSFIKEGTMGLKGLDANFVKKQKKALDYYHNLLLGNYEEAHRRVSKNPSFKVSEKFFKKLKNIDLRNDNDFDEFRVYKELVINDFYKNVRKETVRSGRKYYKIAIENVRKIKKGHILNALLSNMVEDISGADTKSKEIYETIMELSSDDKLKNELKAKMDRFKKLVKGNPSPNFENYENYKGGKTSLKDFRGKYVYIDVWATWCVPCQNELPFMKKIEKKYHKKDIVFVSLSVDKLKNKEVWKKMVKEKEMAGVQLFADKSWNSDFVRNYEIYSVPRFIFLDKKGKIIDANAPRPSDPKLIELFKEYGL